MDQEERMKYLKIALNVIGVLFIVGVSAMMMWIWPSG
jgi:flagellar basal body-associated protein FliL